MAVIFFQRLFLFILLGCFYIFAMLCLRLAKVKIYLRITCVHTVTLHFLLLYKHFIEMFDYQANLMNKIYIKAKNKFMLFRSSRITKADIC